ncbi:MAG TPA: TIGR02757 family protein [Chitinophagaceae bacterium]|nr:TIGR02757 family protein [Chitinophagaceae bacterium]
MDLKEFLDRKVSLYNRPEFIPDDPVSVPHRFARKEDIEIAGFFAAIFAWGGRKTIINKANELIRLMDDAPADFIRQHEESDLRRMLTFCHRTFNPTDLLYFIHFLRHHYTRHASLEPAFTQWMLLGDTDTGNVLSGFHHYFFSLPDAPPRTRKHIATPQRKASCKRLSMFLRWMVRKDEGGVDFGLWSGIRPAQLVCPVDLHVARVGRRLGLITRPAVDWQTAMELTGRLKAFDPEDPVKYDFALFGLGVTERF